MKAGDESGPSGPVNGDGHTINMVKRFKLYRKYWKLVGDLGVWHHPLYLAYKATKTTVHNKRDVISECVLRVSSKNNVQ